MPRVRRSVRGNHIIAAEHEAKIQDTLAKISNGTYNSIRSAAEQTGVSNELIKCIEFLLNISHRLVIQLLDVVQTVFVKAAQYL
jgi:hypothetical protein